MHDGIANPDWRELMKRNSVLLLITCLMWTVSGCGPNPETDETACFVFSEEACTCSDGESGVLKCSDEGKEPAACDCSASGATDGTDDSADSTGTEITAATDGTDDGDSTDVVDGIDYSKAPKVCPTAVIVIKEGEQVIPQTNLHLVGDQSFAQSGPIKSWQWTVVQPKGSASRFIPSHTFPNPTFEVNTVGEYHFGLDVWEKKGFKSCERFKTTVTVIPDEAIHVELTWHTPKDLDESDQGPKMGANLDLHFVLKEFAVKGPDLDKDGKPDGWFNKPFDCYWFNSHPNWG